jgi:Tol biopolymer transport system component
MSGNRYELGYVKWPFFLNERQVIYEDKGSVVLFDWRENQVEILENIQITPRTPFDLHGSVPVPSPDGNFIVWTDVIDDSASSPAKTRALMLYDRRSGEITEILNNLDFPYTWWSLPSWSPDSQKLTFEAGGTIWIMSLRFPEQ